MPHLYQHYQDCHLVQQRLALQLGNGRLALPLRRHGGQLRPVRRRVQHGVQRGVQRGGHDRGDRDDRDGRRGAHDGGRRAGYGGRVVTSLVIALVGMIASETGLEMRSQSRSQPRRHVDQLEVPVQVTSHLRWKG